MLSQRGLQGEIHHWHFAVVSLLCRIWEESDLTWSQKGWKESPVRHVKFAKLGHRWVLG